MEAGNSLEISLLQIEHLLVLDDEDITDYVVEGVIQNFIGIKQYKFEKDGWKALEYLANCKRLKNFPDLILLDLKMPQMPGTEFLLRYEHLFYNDFPKTKLVVITNYYNRFKKEIQHYQAINLILEKPLNRDKFEILQDKLFN
jgi:CheY-like chemotaxis protein